MQNIKLEGTMSRVLVVIWYEKIIIWREIDKYEESTMKLPRITVVYP